MFREIIENSPDAVVVVDDSGTILYANSQTASILGYSPGMLVDKNVDILLPEQYRDEHRLHRDKYYSSPKLRPMGDTDAVLYARHKDGHRIPVEISLSPVRNDDGSTLVSAFIRDVSERIKHRDALAAITEGVSSDVGVPFFASLAQNLAKALAADFVSIGQLSPDNQNRITTLAYLANGILVENIEYELSGTPCAKTILNGICAYTSDIQSMFPEDEMLGEMGAEAYVGVRIDDAENRTLGVMDVIYQRPMQNLDEIVSVMRIFALRAAAELQRIKAEKILKASDEIFSKTFRSSPDPVTIASLDEGRFIEVNDSAVETCGFSREEMIGHTATELGIWVDPEDRNRLVKMVKEKGTVRQMDANLRWQSGDIRNCQISADIIEIHGETFILAIIRDVTEFKNLTDRLNYLASHDTMTGLVNRREFEIRLQRLITASDSESAEHILCFMDLDYFKNVNDTYGHSAGDSLLQQLGQLMRKNIRSRDTLARLGGDEFALLLEHCNLDDAMHILNKILLVIKDYQFEWDGAASKIGVSIGATLINSTNQSISDVLRKADAACYQAKNSGRNCIQFIA